DEPLCGRQPNTAAPAGNHSDLAIQSRHQLTLQFSYCVVDVFMRRPVLLQRRCCAGMVVELRHSASQAASTVSCPCWEGLAEHGQPTHGFLGGGLVLQDIPMLGEQTVFEPDDVGRYPIRGLP